MSSRTINRKEFLTITVSTVAITAFLEACGDDPATSNGSAGSGTAGTGTAGTPATGGTGTAGTGTAGTGTAGTPAAGGTGTAGTGTGGASGGSAGGAAGGKGGTGGASGGTGGASGGSGGAGGSGGSGGAGGGMCGTVTIMQTSTEQHDHIPNDATQLKADLKMHINGAMSTMEFTLPMDGNHVHKITLNVGQVMMLKGGGMVTMIKSTMDGQGPHSHTYTIGCAG